MTRKAMSMPLKLVVVIIVILVVAVVVLSVFSGGVGQAQTQFNNFFRWIQGKSGDLDTTIKDRSLIDDITQNSQEREEFK